MGKIKCTVCLKYKEETSFSNDNKKKNGKRSNCNDCKNKSLREYRRCKRKNDREWVKNTNRKMREFLKNNPEKAKQYYKTKTKEQHIKYMLKQNYGITLETYNEMMLNQGGVCKICGHYNTRRDNNGDVVIQRLSVDHDHKTGKVRGLLCSKCNNGLGSYNDDINLLNKAIDYLKEFE